MHTRTYACLYIKRVYTSRPKPNLPSQPPNPQECGTARTQRHKCGLHLSLRTGRVHMHTDPDHDLNLALTQSLHGLPASDAVLVRVRVQG